MKVRLATVLFAILFGCSLVGPVITYAAWSKQNLVHKLHTEGIETQAQIAGGKVVQDQGVVTFHLDLKWRLKSGAEYRGSTTAGSQYAANFVSNTETPFMGRRSQILARTAPIKYLEADPSQFILHRDPANSERAQTDMLVFGEALSAAGIGGLLIWYSVWRKRRPEPEEESWAEDP